MRARVHSERTTDSARDTREELGRAEPPAYALPGKLRAGQPGARSYEVVIDPLDVPQHFRCRNDNPANPAVAHEQIGTDAMPED